MLHFLDCIEGIKWGRGGVRAGMERRGCVFCLLHPFKLISSTPSNPHREVIVKYKILNFPHFQVRYIAERASDVVRNLLLFLDFSTTL